MANEIIDEKYRNIWGINPKYEKIIETKLTNPNSFNTFKDFVNYAIGDASALMKLNNEEIKNGRTPHRLSYSVYFMYNNNCDKNGNYDGTISFVSKTCNDLQTLLSGISPARLTKYTRDGLLIRSEKITRDDVYRYSLPYDFFIVNDVSIRIVPNTKTVLTF